MQEVGGITVVEDAKASVKIAGTELHVLGFVLHRELSRLDELSLRLVKHDEELPEPASLIEKAVEFSLLRTHDDQAHHYHGEVISVGRTFERDGQNSLLVTARPRLWRLEARSNCRRYLEQTVPEVVQAVLKDAGIPSDDCIFRLSETYPKRDVIVQYRESDLAFISRLLAEEGIYFGPAGHDSPSAYVFSDDPKGLGASEVATLPFVTAIGSARLIDVARHVEQTHAIRPNKVTLGEYDFKRPSLKLEQSYESQDPGPKGSEVYLYPGRFAEESVGKKRAQVLLESIEADREVVSLEIGTVSLLPGYTFTLEDHPYAALNQEYLITSLDLASSVGAQFEAASKNIEEPSLRYLARVTAIPSSRSPYRPPRRELARRLPGLQTGTTAGPGGSEIHTNEEGQVIARLAWDRESALDEKASAWMRTSQVPTGGSMLLPRMNWEVAISYRDGDMDQPFVMSRLYNGATPPPYALPENAGKMALQTATTPGGGSTNELRMSDTKGSEEMFFNASRDMSVQVGNNTTESIGNDAKLKVGVNHKLNVLDTVDTTIGSNQTVNVGANQNIAVTSLMVDDIGADHSLTVGANRDMKVGGDHRRTVDGDSSVTIGANEYTLVVGEVSQSTLANRTHTVGAALAEVTTGSRSLQVGGNRTETSGALKIIVAKGGRGVESLISNSTVGGAFITKVKGDRVDQCTGPISEVAAGVNIMKGKNVTFEATQMLSLTMGGSTITLTPASISVLGASIKLDGNASDLGVVIDN